MKYETPKEFVNNFNKKAQADPDFCRKYDKFCDENLKDLNDFKFPEGYEITDFDEIKRRLGRCDFWKPHLSRILEFVEKYKYITSRSQAREIVIPTTAKGLIDQFGNGMEISRLIADCKKIGLLYTTDNTYHFYGNVHGKLGRSKKYAYSKKVQDAVIALAKKEGIEPKLARCSPELYKHVDLSKEIEKKLANVHIASRMNVSGATNNQIVTYLDTQVYPYKSTIDRLIKKRNSTLPPEEKIKYEYNIHRSVSRMVTKIGLRATSAVSSYKKKHLSAKDIDCEMCSRRRYLRDTLHTIQPNEFDVKSSIFRVNYLLNFGEWLPMEIDCYEKMAGYKFVGNDRKAYKKFAMYLYFCHSPEEVYNHISSLYKKEMKDNKEYRKHAIETIRTLRDNMMRFVGPFFQSEIFYHESNIYIMFLDRISVLNENRRIVQVYDGFYSNENIGTQEDLKILKGVAEKYRNRFMTTGIPTMKNACPVQNNVYHVPETVRELMLYEYEKHHTRKESLDFLAEQALEGSIPVSCEASFKLNSTLFSSTSHISYVPYSDSYYHMHSGCFNRERRGSNIVSSLLNTNIDTIQCKNKVEAGSISLNSVSFSTSLVSLDSTSSSSNSSKSEDSEIGRFNKKKEEDIVVSSLLNTDTSNKQGAKMSNTAKAVWFHIKMRLDELMSRSPEMFAYRYCGGLNG